MKDARAEVDALRARDPGRARAASATSTSATRLSDQVTLSTFHGCPAGEIEAMAAFLMEEMGLHVTVKLNPTLLGKDAVDGLLHDVLGYTEIETRRGGLREGPAVAEQALEMTTGSTERARRSGGEFRLKLSNTLVVANHRAFFPAERGGDVPLGRAAPRASRSTSSSASAARAAELPLSFSAGVDARNFADCVALGLVPVTVCTDLLKPGGYGRLPAVLSRTSSERMRQRWACAAVGELRERHGPAARREQAAADAVARRHGRPALPEAASPAPAAQDRPAPRPLRLHQLRQVPARLPERRQLRLRGRAAREEYESYGSTAVAAVPVAGGRFEVRESHQIATFAGLLQRLRQLRHRSAPRTAAPTSRSRASSARSRPSGSAPTATASASSGARAATGCGDGCRGWSTGSRWTATPTRPSSRTARVTLELRHRERTPVRRVRRRGRARRPHAGRERVPEDGRRCSTASSTRATPAR